MIWKKQTKAMLSFKKQRILPLSLAVSFLLVSLSDISCLTVSAKQKIYRNRTQQLASVQTGDLAQADQLLLENKYREAEDIYRSLADGDNSGDALSGLAVALAKQGTPSKILDAERVLKRA